MAGPYRLIGADGLPYWSAEKGMLGGNSSGRYGRLDCPAALQALRSGDTYRRRRVFFADEATAVTAGYRPCGTCMPEQFRAWKARQAGPHGSTLSDT